MMAPKQKRVWTCDSANPLAESKSESMDFLISDSSDLQCLDFDDYEIWSQPQLTNQPSPPVNPFEIDFTRLKITTPSLSHTVSSSCMVADGSETWVMGMDREARILRYMEKRKKRRFDKTIRYASRKVKAETRPSVKGRFAKKTDSESSLISPEMTDTASSTPSLNE